MAVGKAGAYRIVADGFDRLDRNIALAGLQGFLPWAMSNLMAGKLGPVWPSAPLHLVPAAFMVSMLMGAITLGASSMASTPRAGFGWVTSSTTTVRASGGSRITPSWR